MLSGYSKPNVYCSLLKISPVRKKPPPLFDLQVFAQVLTLCIVSKNEYAAALSDIYHGQSIEIRSKSSLIVEMVLDIGLSYDHGQLAT